VAISFKVPLESMNFSLCANSKLQTEAVRNLLGREILGLASSRKKYLFWPVLSSSEYDVKWTKKETPLH